MSKRKKGPGRSDRLGLSIVELLDRYPDDASAEAWFIAQRWPNGRFCSDCGSTNTVECKDRKPMPYRCRDCRKHFSVRKGTVMQCSKLGLRVWLIAIYLMSTGIKGTASMKVYRDLRIRQPSAWHLMHRLREAFAQGAALPLPGPVEVDEMYVGGLVKNMHKDKRAAHKGTGSAGKSIVAGAKDRATGQVSAAVIEGTRRQDLHVRIAARSPARPGVHR
ncbi:MAG: IS1595 family transposase [Gammaproteobacteria bacterium]|nr:IS1595 family transposase [Gammaproteobacteria bacterium]